jgi:mannose-6-phosphate isomerase-like protein (cupin superfamily)
MTILMQEKMPGDFEVNYTVRRDEPDRYVVEDIEIGGATVSRTTLFAGKFTFGHCHPHPELYICIKGDGILKIGDEELQLSPGSAYWTPADSYHQVYNPNIQTLVFLCIWKPIPG